MPIWRQIQEKGLPCKGAVSLRREAGAVYDLVRHAAVEFSVADGQTVVPLDYAGGNAQGGALFATLADAETGFLGQNVTAIRITFGKPNNFAQYYAEIEAVGHAADQKNGVIIYVL